MMIKDYQEIKKELIIEEIKKHKFLNQTLSGNSMAPFIKEKDKILIQHSNSFEVGDIVAFFVNKFLVVHRIVKIKRKLYITKGDNVRLFDRFTNKSNFIGKVIKVNGIYLYNQKHIKKSKNIAKISYYQGILFKYFIVLFRRKNNSKIRNKISKILSLPYYNLRKII